MPTSVVHSDNWHMFDLRKYKNVVSLWLFATKIGDVEWGLGTFLPQSTLFLFHEPLEISTRCPNKERIRLCIL